MTGWGRSAPLSALRLRRARRRGDDRGSPPPPERRHGGDRERVDAVVERAVGMAAHPVELDLVAGTRRVEGAPEILVLDRLLVGRPPAARLPALDPFGDAEAEILRVGVEIDRAGAAQRLERLDGGGE